MMKPRSSALRERNSSYEDGPPWRKITERKRWWGWQEVRRDDPEYPQEERRRRKTMTRRSSDCVECGHIAAEWTCTTCEKSVCDAEDCRDEHNNKCGFLESERPDREMPSGRVVP